MWALFAIIVILFANGVSSLRSTPKMMNSFPQPTNRVGKKLVENTVKLSLAFFLSSTQSKAISIEEESKLYGTKISISDDGIYQDLDNGFSIMLPEGWKKYPRAPVKLKINELLNKDIKFEESLLVAKCFAEGAVLSVTRSNHLMDSYPIRHV